MKWNWQISALLFSIDNQSLLFGSSPLTPTGQCNEISSPDLVLGQHRNSSHTGGQYEDWLMLSRNVTFICQAIS